MATLNSITNKLTCGLSGLLGAGLAHCKFKWNDMAGGAVLLLKKGTELPSDFTIANVTALIKSGKAVFIKNHYSFEVQTSEDQKETSSGGIVAVATKGLYGFMFKYINGLLFDTVLASLNSYGSWDAVFFDAAGNGIYYTSNSGKRKGFSLGMLNATPIEFGSGATATKTGIEMQLINRAEMDKGLSAIDSDVLDFSIFELEDVNQLEISLNAVADGDTAITGKIVSAWDGTLTSTEITEAALTVTGATATAATVDADGNLNITISAVSTDDAISVKLNGVFEDTEGLLFKSNTANLVVTA